MSNELATILQNSPSLVQTGLDEDTRAVAGGATTGNKRISIRGGVFRKMVGGKEVSAIEDRHMNVVIVKMAHTASRTFYAQAYKEGEKVSPTCWSNDSRTPDADVPTPQAKSCDTCQFSAKGSGAGGSGSACRLSWRMAVVLPNDPSGDVMQLVLPATSCFGKEDNGKWPFRPYIQMLANNNVSAGRVVSRMQFDTKSPTPKVLFSPAAAVPEEDIGVIQNQGKSQVAEQAVKLTVYQQDSSESPQVSTTPQPVQVEEPTPQAEAKPTEPVVEEPVLRNQEQVQAQAQKVKDVGSILNKWATKD